MFLKPGEIKVILLTQTDNSSTNSWKWNTTGRSLDYHEMKTLTESEGKDRNVRDKFNIRELSKNYFVGMEVKNITKDNDL